MGANGSHHFQQAPQHRNVGTPPGAVLELEAPDDELSARSGSSSGAGGRLPLVQRVARVSFLTAMLMGVALCFHSLLEGAAMGAQVRGRGLGGVCTLTWLNLPGGVCAGVGVGGALVPHGSRLLRWALHHCCWSRLPTGC